MTLTLDELTVLVEAAREYRLRAPLSRRPVIESALVKILAQLTKEGDDT